MNIEPVVFLDLDDTIFQTPRKMREMARAVPAAIDGKGQPSSWMSARQHAFFLWLSAHAAIIPVTGRSSGQLARVLLPFKSWRIAAHGAVIIQPDGSLHKPWQARITALVTPLRKAMREIAAICNEHYETREIGARARVEEENGLGIYVVSKHANGEKLAELYSVRPLLEKNRLVKDFDIIANDNNLSIIPKGLGKDLAIREIAPFLDLDSLPALGFGDSLSDLPFMNLCDFWGTPRNSQIARKLLTE